MKAIIVERGGKITSDRENELTIGSSEALRRCVSNEEFRCITGEEAISVQNLNLLRDAAQHYIVDVSEGQLYIYAQSGITIFRKLVADEFGDQKAGEVPDRLSLVSSAMPDSFAGMLDDEFEQLREMLAPGSRKRLDAKAKIRAMAVLERSLSGSGRHHTEKELDTLAEKISSGDNWTKIFPGVKSLRIDPEGIDRGLILRIVKSGGDDEGAVALVPEGTPGAAVVGVRKINDLSYYSLYFNKMLAKIQSKYPALNRNDLLGMIADISLKDDPEMYKQYKMGKQTHKRYSPKALDRLMKLSKTHPKVAE
jgi:hypothetical protein